jgi:hypothetical protein
LMSPDEAEISTDIITSNTYYSMIVQVPVL